MDILGSLNGAISIATRLKEISKNIEDAEFSNLLADLSLELADTKLALAQLTEEHAQLKNDLTKLKHSQGAASKLDFRGYAYFTEDGDGPYCPGCYDSQSKHIRLSKLPSTFDDLGSHTCPECKNVFSDST